MFIRDADMAKGWHTGLWPRAPCGMEFQGLQPDAVLVKEGHIGGAEEVAVSTTPCPQQMVLMNVLLTT